MQWIQHAKDVCCYDKDKGSPAAGGGLGYVQRRSRYQELPIDTFVVYLLHVKSVLGNPRHRPLWIMQHRRKPSQLPLQKAVANLTNLYHRGMRRNFTWGCDVLEPFELLRARQTADV